MAGEKYRKGFKAEANKWAVELRSELDLTPSSPMCPWALCEHLSIPIINMSSLPNRAEKSYLLKGDGKDIFSATVLYDGTQAIILSNDTQHKKRQASNIAHEVAHVLLGHPPCPPFEEDGRRGLLKVYEDEAEWLGPALLVSEQAALSAYRLIQAGAHTLHSLSDQWKVTTDVIQMRMNVVGARRRIAA